MLLRRFPGLDEQFLDDLAGLELIEFLDADTIELLGHVIGILHLHVVLIDDALDEALLTVGAVPDVTGRLRLRIIRPAVSVELIGAAVLGLLSRFFGLGAETDVLNLLIDGVLEELVEPLTLGVDFGDVREFNIYGDAETVTAEFWQADFLAVDGAELDHDVGWW